MQIPGSDLQIFSGKKIRRDQIEALKKAGVEGIELAESEREGAFAAVDVVAITLPAPSRRAICCASRDNGGENGSSCCNQRLRPYWRRCVQAERGRRR